MNTIHDSAFGEMVYRYSWEKEFTLNLWGHAYNILIKASASKGTEIDPKQQEQYLKVKGHFEKIINDNLIKIKESCIKIFNLSEVPMSEVTSKLHPRTILFQRDGTWGILFDCEYDKEHGLALYFENNEFKVGLQDDFL